MIIVSVRYQCPLLIDNRTDWTALNILAQWHCVPKTLPEASHDSRRSVSPLPIPVYQRLLHDSRARHATWYATRQIPPDSLANLSKRKLIILRLSAHTEAPSLENYLQLENNWSQRAYLRLTIRCDSLLSRLHWPQPMCHRAKKATHCASAYKQAGSTKNMWTAMLYSKHMWVWMVLVPLSDLKLSGCQDKEAPRFFASLFFILLIRSSIFSRFHFLMVPLGKMFHAMKNKNRALETALSCLNVIIARIIRTLKEICFYIYNNVPSEAPLSSSDNFISSVIVHSEWSWKLWCRTLSHKGLKVWVTWLTNVNEWWKPLNDCHYRRNH